MDPNTLALIQTLAQGLLTGGIYALIGTGLSLIFGVMRVINFAHGDFLALGMFIALFLFQRLHLDPYLSLLIAAAHRLWAGLSGAALAALAAGR